MSDINFCNTKEQLNHLGEVVTGKVDGSPTGADIDESTLPYTGQVRRTLPSLEAEYEQSITDKEAEADAAIDSYRLLNKGQYASGITLESKFEYITYNGESYFATNPPYTTTATLPDADGNLFLGGYTTFENVANKIGNKNELSNSNFLIQSPEDITHPNATPESYVAGTQIFSGVYAGDSGCTVTFIDGRVNCTAGDYKFKIPNTGGLDRVPVFASSVSDYDGIPKTTGVSHALVADEYVVTVTPAAGDVFSVKLEQGSVATRHEVYTGRGSSYVFNTIKEMQDSGSIPVGAVVSIHERGDAIFDAVTGESPTGYGVLATGSGNVQLKVRTGTSGAKLEWYGVKANKVNDDLPATQEAANENSLTIWPAGDILFIGQLEAPEDRHTKYQGQGLGITNVYGVDGQQLTTLAGPNALSLTARDITFNGEFDRSGINYPYHANGGAAPKGAKWAFTYTSETDCSVDYSGCEFRDFYELPFACFNVKGRVKFNDNVLWKTKDPGFVNCDDIECLNNKSYFGHDNGFSLSRGNKNVRARGNFAFSPAFVGIACYGFPISGVDELGPDCFDVSGNIVLFSGQANISNVRAARNGTVSHNICKYAGCYCDQDKVDTIGSITSGNNILTVVDATNIDNGSKLVLIPKTNTGVDFFFCEVVSGGGTTSLTVDRNAPGAHVDSTVYLIQYNGNAQGYVSSGSTDGTDIHGEGVNVHDNLFLGFAKVGMQLGTTTGSIRDGSVHDNQVKKLDPVFDGAVIGIELTDSGDTSYRTSSISVKDNKISLTGNANAKGIRYTPVDNSLSSFCTIEGNTVSGTTDDNRFEVPDEFNPSNSGITPNTKSIMAFAESINVRGVASISGNTLTATGRYCRGSAASPVNITDIAHTYEGSEYPEFVYENTGANAVTFVHNTSKIRLNGGANKVIGIYETIRFIRITPTVFQEI